jgi:hypothetical protein
LVKKLINTGIPLYCALLRAGALLLFISLLWPRLEIYERIFIGLLILLFLMLSDSYTNAAIAEDSLIIGKKRLFRKNKKYVYPLRSVQDLEFEPLQILPFLQLNKIDLFITLEGHQGRIDHRMVGSTKRLKKLVAIFYSLKAAGRS